jgi:hypothetical protein
MVVAVNIAEQPLAVTFSAPAVAAAGAALVTAYGHDNAVLAGQAVIVNLAARGGSVWVAAK